MGVVHDRDTWLEAIRSHHSGKDAKHQIPHIKSIIKDIESLYPDDPNTPIRVSCYIQVLEEYGDYSLSYRRDSTASCDPAWDKQFAELLAPTTPIYITETKPAPSMSFVATSVMAPAPKKKSPPKVDDDIPF